MEVSADNSFPENQTLRGMLLRGGISPIRGTPGDETRPVVVFGAHQRSRNQECRQYLEVC